MPKVVEAKHPTSPNHATSDLDRALTNACRKWHAREIRLRYLPRPSLSRWIAEALIEHHHVPEKIREDIAAGELTLRDLSEFSDKPIARGVGGTAVEAVKSMEQLTWRQDRQ